MLKLLDTSSNIIVLFVIFGTLKLLKSSMNALDQFLWSIYYDYFIGYMIHTSHPSHIYNYYFARINFQYWSL